MVTTKNKVRPSADFHESKPNVFCNGEFCDLVKVLDPDRDLFLYDDTTNNRARNKSKAEREVESRDRAFRVLERVLARSEISELEESGKSIQLRISGRIDPFGYNCVPVECILETKREHRLAFLELAIAEGSTTLSKEKWDDLIKLKSSHSKECQSRGGLFNAQKDTCLSDSSHSIVVPEGSAIVCVVCYHVYRLLSRVRMLLSEKCEKTSTEGTCNADAIGLDHKLLRTAFSKRKNRDIDIGLATNFEPPVRNSSSKDGKSRMSENCSLLPTEKNQRNGKKCKSIRSPCDESKTHRTTISILEEFEKTRQEILDQTSKYRKFESNLKKTNDTKSQKLKTKKVNTDLQINEKQEIHDCCPVKERLPPMKDQHIGIKVPNKKKFEQRKGFNFVSTDTSKSIDPNTKEGMLKYEKCASFLYTVMDCSFSPGVDKVTGQRKLRRHHHTLFNMVVCHDLFDTQERFKIFLSPMVARYPGMQILLWNYPGQAFTTFSESQLLNNEFHAKCLAELLKHVGPSGTKDFDTNRPFYIMGYGYGGSIATYYSANFRPPRLRAILLFNPLSFVDTHFASVIHDCRNVFSCSPETRPDLPVYFFSRFLFSSDYLEKTSTPLALNLHTAVHNPITLKGRIQLCGGVLKNIDVRDMIKDIPTPIISVHGNKSALVRPIHAVHYLEGRKRCKTIFQSLDIEGSRRTFILVVDGGHELFQEKKKLISNLIEQLLTGYHDKNNVRFSMEGENCEVISDHQLSQQQLQETALYQIHEEVEPSKCRISGPLCEGHSENKVVQAVEFFMEKSISTERYHWKKSERDFQCQTMNNRKISYELPVDPQKSSTRPLVSLLNPDPKEYMNWRLKRNKKRLSRYQRSAQIIQNALRVFMAKTMIHRLRRQTSALSIQRVFRGNKGRLLYLQTLKELWAARFVQRAYRGRLGRLKSYDRRMLVQAQKKVARIWRGVAARKLVHKIILQRSFAATLLQCLWRRRKATHVAFNKRIRRNAAISLQRVYRGHQGLLQAQKERERYLFSRSQTNGIELGRKMLTEHKLHATRLQSELSILDSERISLETRADGLLDEINCFENGVKSLESQMHRLTMTEKEQSFTSKGTVKQELRDQKVRLDQEFSSMLTKILGRKEQLKILQDKIGQLTESRQSKTEELKSLERKLVVLLEAQETQLAEIRHRQQKNGERIFYGQKQEPQTAGCFQGPSEHEKRQAAQLMDSTETMMKFGFMSMSMTYFSSLNMMRAMKTVSAQDTIMSSMSHANAERSTGEEMATNIGKKINNLQNQSSQVDIEKWNIEDVAQWLSAINLTQYATSFQDGSVDGQFLSELTDDDLRNTLGVEHKLHRKKILFSIRQLVQGRSSTKSRSQGNGNVIHNENDSSLPSPVERSPIQGGNSHSIDKRHEEVHKSMSDSPQRTQQILEPDDTDHNVGGLKSMEPTRKQVPPLPSVDEFSTWVRNQKVEFVKEGLKNLPEKLFDNSYVRVQFVEGTGTAYTRSYERELFHLNKTDEHGNTVLHIAAQNGNLHLGKILIKKGANPNHQNKHGQTPGHYAVAFQFYDFASWLFDADGGNGNDLLMNMYGLGPYDGLTIDDT